MSIDLYGFDDPGGIEVNQAALADTGQAERLREEVEARQQLEAQQAQEAAATQAEYERTTNEDGTPKSSQEVMDPKKFGTLENAQELGNALLGGAIDIYNSVASVPKFFDPEFYQSDKENPYEFEAPWLITAKPINRTVWGKTLRSIVEFAGGAIGVGKVGWGIKGVQGLAKAANLVDKAGKVSRAGRVAGAAISSGAYDMISNQSQEANIAQTLGDIKPDWKPYLSTFATTDDMSPAQRTMYNTLESLGIGAVGDLVLEAAGAGIRAVGKGRKAVTQQITDPEMAKMFPNKALEAADSIEELEYVYKTERVETSAKEAYEETTGAKWAKLDDATKQDLMQQQADELGIDWGERKFERRAEKQGQTNLDVAEDQLLDDLDAGAPRENPAYMQGGDVTDHQGLTNTSRPMKGVRDQIRIRNDFSQKDGSPRGPLSEAQIRRMEYGAPGMTQEEIDKLADGFVVDPVYQKLYGGDTPTEVKQDFLDMAVTVREFLDESGHSRVNDASPEELVEFIETLRYVDDADKQTKIEGVSVLNQAQLVATDLIMGQLLTGARDLSRAALSVMDQVDVKAQGSILDGILARYATLSRMRKETSIMSSWNLRRFRPGIDDITLRTDASDAVAAEVETLKQLLKDDVDDSLLQTFLHFSAVGGNKPQTFKDLQAFMKRKLHGYRDGNKQMRNQIINEMQIMGVNSILSGPKTPVRAAVGTGIGTIMRPVATIIGSLGSEDRAVTESAFAALGGMWESMGDAWRKAAQDFRGYTQNNEGWRGITTSAKEYEFEALKAFHYKYGSDGDKAAMAMANFLHQSNKLPFLNYGPRIMRATDVFFSQLIGRGRQRQLAFLDVKDRLKSSQQVVSDQDMKKLVRAAELNFESKVFTADGQLSDEMAKYAADEAKLTKELTGFARELDRAFDKAPYLKPFMLFMKTGVNALEMTSKHTPILNRFIKENVDIMTKAWDDPVMVKYGIKSANDLEIAKATMRGREALGYGFVSTAAMMALNGQITGNGPPDRELREAWQQFGWKPRSVKIGDTYVSYESLEPFNLFFSFIADIVDSQKVMGEEWVGNNLGKLGFLVTQNITNKTFLNGMFQVQELFYSNGQRLPTVAANLVNNQIPLGGMRNEIGKLVSPGMRELEKGFLDGIRNRNLYLDLVAGEDGKLPYRYDILDGRPINDSLPIVRLMNAVNPFYINPATNPTRELLFRSGVDLKLTFNTGPNNESLEGNPDLKSKWQYYISKQNIEGQLQTLFKDKAVIKSILDMEEDRAAGRRYETSETFHVPLINNILKKAKSNAWAELMSDTPEVRELNEQSRLETLSGRYRKMGSREKANEIEDLLSIIK